MKRHPPRATPFPSTTLFRSTSDRRTAGGRRGPERARPPPLGAESDRARRRRCLFGFVPGLPEAKLDPEVVLVAFLPPLLYRSEEHTSELQSPQFPAFRLLLD